MSDWKYDIDEVGEDADATDPDASDRDPDAFGDGPSAVDRDGDDSGSDGRDRGPLEPGSPSVENAFFVALGVATMLFLLARLVTFAG